MIEAQQLVKHYGDTRAVENVSFTVQPGEVVGLLGPNGAGKSTTLRMLTGYLPPTRGTVRLAGYDVQQHPLEARRRVGYLSETNPLYESLGVWECLELVAGLRGLPSAGLAKRLGHVAETCALLDVVSKDVGALSKGYRQRLGLALAILHDPDILILDEPSSALDPNQQKDVRALILTLKQKKTVLLSTHILPEAQNLCDRLLVIHRGKIVAEGTVKELEAQRQGGQAYFVRFRGPRVEVEASLGVLPDVSGVEFVDEEDGGPGFSLSAASDPRLTLFELATRQRWPLLELRRKTASLDEIFQALTGGSPS